MKIVNYLKLNDNENTVYQTMQVTAKGMLMGKCIALNAYILICYSYISYNSINLNTNSLYQ